MKKKILFLIPDFRSGGAESVFVQLANFFSLKYEVHYMVLRAKGSNLKKLKTNNIAPEKLAFMTHQEMFPEKRKELVDAKIKRDKNLTEIDMSAATDEFKCYKCQKRVCSYYQLQTRSADEPMTAFITCLNCGNRWKQ